MSKPLTALIFVTLLGACGGGDRGLRDLRNPGNGPDEFSVLPVKPLEMPASLGALPPPVTNAPNRVDTSPVAQGIAALGGRASAGSSDGALVAAASRFGVPSGIRQTVTTEDTALRTRASGLFRRAGRYFSAYGDQALDAQAELARLRAAGVQTVTAPPAE